MEIKQKFISEEKRGLKCPLSIHPNSITIHEINSWQSAETVANYVSNSNHPVSAHIFVDEKEAIQVIPYHLNSFACGDRSIRSRNTISIEICRSETRDGRYEFAVENAVQVVRKVMSELGITRVCTHHDWSGADCPKRMRKENKVNEFIKRCKKKEERRCKE